MKRLVNIVLILITVGTNTWNPVFARSYEPAAAEKKYSSTDKIKLFNGKNLNGWYTYLEGQGRDNDPNKVFTVNKGLLTISGEVFGCITTNDEYENYKLVAEFKWGETTHGSRVGKAMDSGILLHSVGEDGAASGYWMYSIECQLIEGGTGDIIVVGNGTPEFSVTCPVDSKRQDKGYVFKPGGEMVTLNGNRVDWYGRDPNWKDVKGFRGANDIEKPAGEWNTIECVVQGGEIIINLNGKLVNHAFDVQPRKGRIQVQSEGAEIIFRRIDLRQLPPN